MSLGRKTSLLESSICCLLSLIFKISRFHRLQTDTSTHRFKVFVCLPPLLDFLFPSKRTVSVPYLKTLQIFTVSEARHPTVMLVSSVWMPRKFKENIKKQNNTKLESCSLRLLCFPVKNTHANKPNVKYPVSAKFACRQILLSFQNFLSFLFPYPSFWAAKQSYIYIKSSPICCCLIKLYKLKQLKN